jgi:hypothetical protein
MIVNIFLQTSQTTFEFINIHVTCSNNLQKKLKGLFYIIPSVVAAMYQLLKVTEVVEGEVVEVVEGEVVEGEVVEVVEGEVVEVVEGEVVEAESTVEAAKGLCLGCC